MRPTLVEADSRGARVHWPDDEVVGAAAHLRVVLAGPVAGGILSLAGLAVALVVQGSGRLTVVGMGVAVISQAAQLVGLGSDGRMARDIWRAMRDGWNAVSVDEHGVVHGAV